MSSRVRAVVERFAGRAPAPGSAAEYESSITPSLDGWCDLPARDVRQGVKDSIPAKTLNTIGRRSMAKLSEKALRKRDAARDIGAETTGVGARNEGR